jgi:hypothetical protein
VEAVAYKSADISMGGFMTLITKFPGLAMAAVWLTFRVAAEPVQTPKW